MAGQSMSEIVLTINKPLLQLILTGQQNTNPTIRSTVFCYTSAGHTSQ